MSTSWESSAKWYDASVGEKGHYYHENVIFPNLLRLLDLKNTPSPKVLDLACGQGVLAREIPKEIPYVGVDISQSLIKAASERNKNKNHRFLLQDLTKKLDLPEKDFTDATLILALQNIEEPIKVFDNAVRHLRKGGKLFIVMNHPAFRIPRQTHWGVDEKQKLMFRRIDSYLSSLKIPLQTHPGKGPAIETISFHHPISAYTKWLKLTGFSIVEMEEWISDKTSTGGRARMENRARDEFPLFLTIVASKN